MAKKRQEDLDKVFIGNLLEQYQDEKTILNIEHDFAIYCREELLNIAFRNILNNACKYSHGKAVEVIVSKKSVTIRDYGIGIPKEEQAHIFEPFYRATNADGVVGHGIGLALAKNILERYGAKVQVRSAVDVGTTFKIVFR